MAETIGTGPLVRVQNDAGGYRVWVSQDAGESWAALHESPLAQRVEEARKSWAAAHPLPDPWFGDLPTGIYRLTGRGVLLPRGDDRPSA